MFFMICSFIMPELPQDEPSKEKLKLLLFNLGEMLKDLPIIIDLYNWRDDVEYVMEEIKSLCPYIYNRLEDLVSRASQLAALHVNALDSDAPPNELEQSRINYFGQIAFVNSEINAIKSL